MRQQRLWACLLALGATAGCNSILGIDAAVLSVDSGPSGASGPMVDAAAQSDDASDSGDVADADATVSDDDTYDAQADVGSADAGSDVITPSYEVSCSNYCRIIQAACTGDNSEYLNPAVCLAFCSILETSSEVLTNAEPTPSDDLNCRVWHANAAIVSPHVHCPHAGPLGGSICNADMGRDPCEPFCTMDLAFCNAQTTTMPGYSSVQQCLDDCRGVPDGGGYVYEDDPGNATIGDLTTQFQEGSNTLNCRMYHLENVVATSRPDTHCPHTSLSGGGICVSADM